MLSAPILITGWMSKPTFLQSFQDLRICHTLVVVSPLVTELGLVSGNRSWTLKCYWASKLLSALVTIKAPCWVGRGTPHLTRTDCELTSGIKCKTISGQLPSPTQYWLFHRHRNTRLHRERRRQDASEPTISLQSHSNSNSVRSHQLAMFPGCCLEEETRRMVSWCQEQKPRCTLPRAARAAEKEQLSGRDPQTCLTRTASRGRVLVRPALPS